MATSRIGTDGSYNIAYGLDGMLNIFGSEFLTVKWAQTVDQATLKAREPDVTAASPFTLKWERRDIQGLSYEVEMTR